MNMTCNPLRSLSTIPMCKHMFYSSETPPCMCLTEVKNGNLWFTTHAAPDPWSHCKSEVKGSMAVAYRGLHDEYEKFIIQ